MIDLPRLENAVRETLLALGEDPNRAGLRDTPHRVASSWRDFYSGSRMDIHPLPDTAAREDDCVIVKNIDFVSVCEHHLLPFSGVAHIAYEPGSTLLGLGDVARVVRRASSGLQLQETLTAEIAAQIETETSAHGVLVVLDARHGCVSDRGLRHTRVRATTTTTLGTLAEASKRDALLSLIATPDPTA